MTAVAFLPAPTVRTGPPPRTPLLPSPRPASATPPPPARTTRPRTPPARARREHPHTTTTRAPPPQGDTMPENDTTTPTTPMVRVEDLHRSYGSGENAVHALRGVSFDLPRGELIALRGRSGSGKTTLLNLVGGLDTPGSGRVLVDDTDLSALDENGLLALRRERVGFVFQTFGLVPILSAAENIEVPLRLRKVSRAEREERVSMLLSLVGLGDHANQRPGELSGGQRQRVSIARALANRPSLLIADEPTGQLDADTGLAVMELLRAVVRSEHVTALVATHDTQLLALADRVLHLADGVTGWQDDTVPAA
ncbi:putative ABC transporter ATP-binding protein [Streptomyces sp. Tu6071]|nr:putative ABC transporter ATP-binding protein [Streptomyces sp. Tu6071]